MSKETLEKKKEEIEGFEKQEKEDMEKIRHDACPLCGLPTVKFPYISFIPTPYGWLECPSCGTVFCPKSLRDQKIKNVKEHFASPTSPIVLTT